jgi:hypothetical protein
MSTRTVATDTTQARTHQLHRLLEPPVILRRLLPQLQPRTRAQADHAAVRGAWQRREACLPSMLSQKHARHRIGRIAQNGIDYRD